MRHGGKSTHEEARRLFSGSRSFSRLSFFITRDPACPTLRPKEILFGREIANSSPVMKMPDLPAG